MYRFLILFLTGLFAAVPVVAFQKADLIIFNANIHTMAKKQPRAEAVAISGSRIFAVGSSAKIRKLGGPETALIDAKGKLLIPGFNDSHVHFLPLGNTFSTLNASGITSADGLLKRIVEYTNVLPKGRWILGSGISFELTESDLKAIDIATAENPLLIYLAGGKRALVNKAAAKENARIVADKELDIIRRSIPKDHTTNWLEVGETASKYAASLGITSIQEMSSDDRRDVYRRLEQEGRLKTRIYDCSALGGSVNKDIADDTEMVRGGCRKGFWEGEDERIPELTRDVLSADKAGLQIMIHAMGGEANNVVLSIFDQTARTNGKRDRRFRIEHANGVDDTARKLFREIPVIASVQPHLFRSASDQFVAFRDADVELTFGSDAAMTDMDPLLGIRDLVNLSGGKFTVEQAVRAYTVGSAYAEFQENVKGTIEVGKYADIILLSDDIFTIDRTKIGSVSVDVTIVGGKVVYERTDKF